MERASGSSNCRIGQGWRIALLRALRRAYGYSEPQVARVLDQIPVTAEIPVESEEAALRALDAYRPGPDNTPT